MDKKVLDIVSYLNELFPEVSCELNYCNDIQLLIAVVLSAQTTDKAVNKVTEKLYADYPTINELVTLSEKEIEDYIKRLGLYKNKSKNVYNLCKIIYNDFAGVVPSCRKDLESLPGVGRKTANVMLAEYFNIPAFAVDTHVDRISKRLKLAYLKDNVNTVEKKLMKKFPKDTWIKLHHQFIHFGRYFCTARSPKCFECKLKMYCRDYKN